MAFLCLGSIEFLNAQTLCTGTAPTPCVLTTGYAGPATDANFNKRQNINPYETILSPTTLPSTTAPGMFFPVDYLKSDLPANAVSNPIMAQPLYVAGITIPNTPCKGSCNMVVAETLNGTVFAWIAGGPNAGTQLWSRQGTNPLAPGTNALWYDDCRGTGPVILGGPNNLPFMGILSTPVIDTSGTPSTPPVMYLTSFCETSPPQPQAEWWLHEINLKNGQGIATTNIGNDVRTLGHTDFKDGNQWQRPALLQVKNPNNANYPNLIYMLFGTGTVENGIGFPYSGWLVAYNASASGLTPVFAYSNEPAAAPGCGTGGGFTGPITNQQPNKVPQCSLASPPNQNGNGGTPPCDCFAASSLKNAPNWGGHGGGCWMSGNGPAATTVDALGPDGVHVYFGCGNGGFQLFTDSPPAPNNYYGQTVMDFRLKDDGTYDSDATGPFQTFTPNRPASSGAQGSGLQGLAPPLPVACGCDDSDANCAQCTYTVQSMNAYDYDQSASGVVLFNQKDTNDDHWLVTIDKGGYGYLVHQGALCGLGSTDMQCIGFAQGDQDVWTFGATNQLCTGLPGECHRVSGLAVTDVQGTNNGKPVAWAIGLNYWPNHERLTALQLSDGSTPIGGTGELTADSSHPYQMNLTIQGLPCSPDVNCLPEQVVPGDTLTLPGCPPCQGSACPPTITSAAEDAQGNSELTLNTMVTTAFGSCANSAQSFKYTGYLITPAHDNSSHTPVAGYPGGMLTVSENCTVSPCASGLIWAVVPDHNSNANSGQRGLGTLYAYSALPNPHDILQLDWQTNTNISMPDIWCASSFARPTIANGSVFVPTYAVGTTGSGTPAFTGTCPVAPDLTNGPYPSGLKVYTANPNN